MLLQTIDIYIKLFVNDNVLFMISRKYIILNDTFKKYIICNIKIIFKIKYYLKVIYFDIAL